jgi:hypothetical protein
MASDDERVEELEEEIEEREHEVARLMEEVDRYRTATEDALQQLDWCIGYLVGCNKGRIAEALGANRSYIRRCLMNRSDQPTPTTAARAE